jgi:FkbM family methyltransferase
MKIIGITITRSRNIDPGLRLRIVRDRFFAESDFIIDVGANSGQWLSEIKDALIFKKILAIEPVKSTFKKLNLKFGNYKNITLVNCAIGTKEEIKQINISSNEGLSSSLLKFSEYHQIADPTVKMVSTEKVKIRKLSTLLESTNFEKGYLKIDVQGYELEVLKSISKSDWKRIKFLEIEVNLVESYQSSAVIEDVFKFLRAKGFQPYRIEPGFGSKNFGQQIQMDVIFQHES